MSTEYFEKAAEVAANATCLRAKCGSIIVAEDGMVIGEGYNAPPLGYEDQRTCEIDWDTSVKPKYDTTCCVHAEWNAILDACKRHPEKIGGATLYFMRIDEKGGFTDAGEPYCTVCSRLALQSGIEYFSLWNGGEERFSTKHYNLASYSYFSSNNEGVKP